LPVIGAREQPRPADSKIVQEDIQRDAVALLPLPHMAVRDASPGHFMGVIVDLSGSWPSGSMFQPSSRRWTRM